LRPRADPHRRLDASSRSTAKSNRLIYWDLCELPAQRIALSLVLSKVGNFAIDLPDADVLIQVSGAFGSRQEEAQRLGRILRPKQDGRAAHFFTLVSRDTREEEFAHHRKLFLTEQGYSYRVVVADE